MTASAPHPPRGVRIIGIVGGVGAGKSAVACELERLGCVVYDADAAVRRQLETPEVREAVHARWGGDVFDDAGANGGGVDRSKLARIVFSDAAEREALEAIVHPRLRGERLELIERAEKEGAPAVVLDAPLLFEAGLDAECDAVIFVEAPRAARLARLAANRGWDDAELARREKSQTPLEIKRRRSHYVVVNDGGPDELRGRVESIFPKLLQGAPPHDT